MNWSPDCGESGYFSANLLPGKVCPPGGMRVRSGGAVAADTRGLLQERRGTVLNLD